MKYKYKILLVLSITLIYSSLTYFSEAGVPIKTFITILSTLIFFRDERDCENSLYLMIPSLLIGYTLSVTFKSINSEWFLFLGFTLWFTLVYIYSYILKILSSKKVS